jgi:hypothetical protein
MTTLFGSEWVKKVLGIDTFWGRMRFKSRLKKAVVIAIMSGTLLTVFPGFVKKAEAATGGQHKTYSTLLTALYTAGEQNDKKAIDFFVDEMVKQIFQLFKTLEKELQEGDTAKAKETIKLLINYAEMVGLEKKVKAKIEHIQKTVREIENNKAVKNNWDAALVASHAMKKAGKGIEYYNVTISGSNWRFEISHSPIGFKRRASVRGDTINLNDIDDALEKTGMSKEQQAHARKIILRILQKDYPKSALVAE